MLRQRSVLHPRACVPDGEVKAETGETKAPPFKCPMQAARESFEALCHSERSEESTSLFGTKGCAFRISLNALCGRHRGGPAHGRRSSPEVPWPDGINHSSYVQPNLIVQLNKNSRGLVESAETCKKDPDGIFFGLKAEIETRIYMDAHSCS